MSRPVFGCSSEWSVRMGRDVHFFGHGVVVRLDLSVIYMPKRDNICFTGLRVTRQETGT